MNLQCLFASGRDNYGELGLPEKQTCYNSFTQVDTKWISMGNAAAGTVVAESSDAKRLPLPGDLVPRPWHEQAVRKVVAGASATLVLLANGSVAMAGGEPSDGRAGRGFSELSFFFPSDRGPGAIELATAVDVAVTATEVVVCTESAVWVKRIMAPRPEAASQQPPRSIETTTRKLLLPDGEGCFTAVSAGAAFIVALCRSGKVVAAGLNSYGQLGIGSLDDRVELTEFSSIKLPAHVAAIHVQCGGCHAFVLTSSGELYVWGRNHRGQLGLGHCVDQSAPVLLSLDVSIGKEASSYCSATPMNSSSSELEGSGEPLPTAKGASALSPVCAVPAPAVRVQHVVCGDAHTVLILSDGSVLSCGCNASGQLGLGRGGAPPSDVALCCVSRFTHVPLPGGSRAAILADPTDVVANSALHSANGGFGRSHTILTLQSGELIGCGSNHAGQLGLGQHVPSVNEFIVLRLPPAGLLLSLYGKSQHRQRTMVSCGWQCSVVALSAMSGCSRGDRGRVPPLGRMSFDLRRVTAGYLPLTDALAASLVNREWLTAVRHADYLWRPRFAAAFPYELELVDLETTSTFASIDWVLLWGETVRRRFKSVSNVEFGCGAPSQRSSDSQPVVSSEASAISRVFGTAIRSASSVLPSAVTKWLFPPPLKILMTGLNSTGKTTILSALKLGRPAAYSTIPTVGFNVEDIPSSRDGVLPFTCWEVGGGGAAMRALWRHFFHGVHGHIYVVDGSDRDRLVESGSALAALRVSLHSLPCLVYVNKQDVPGCMLPGEVAARLDACKALPGVWCVQGCSGATAQGLAEGLVWLSAAVAANKMCAYSSQEN